MGNTWEVSAWQADKNGYWDYVIVYQGENPLKAIYHAVKAHYTCWCIRIIWR